MNKKVGDKREAETKQPNQSIIRASVSERRDEIDVRRGQRLPDLLKDCSLKIKFY